ncbi:MAG: hypothetical protein Q3998_05420 [Porphyromonas sp.]|nr:hypothetical protein [Porphyromonas sp.]
MKRSFLGVFSALVLLFCCYGKSNAQVGIKGEVGVGLFSLNGGLYTTFGERHMAGVSATGGLMFPILVGQFSPQYRYYFSGHKGNPNGWSGSFFVNAGANLLMLKGLHAESPNVIETSVGNWKVSNFYFYYLNAGGGYELRYKKFYIRPTINVMFPDSVSGLEQVVANVFFASVLQTSIGFRF